MQSNLGSTHQANGTHPLAATRPTRASHHHTRLKAPGNFPTCAERYGTDELRRRISHAVGQTAGDVAGEEDRGEVARLRLVGGMQDRERQGMAGLVL